MSASRTRLLRWLLRGCGALTLLALPAVFLPQPAMDYFHRSLGLGPLPEGPIVLYLARSLSAFYAAFGALTLLLSTDVERYAPLITWWGMTAIVLGVLLIGIDLTAGMPIDWMLGEVIFTICAGSAVLLLQRASRDGAK
jgi:hypothetical protein